MTTKELEPFVNKRVRIKAKVNVYNQTLNGVLKHVNSIDLMFSPFHGRSRVFKLEEVNECDELGDVDFLLIGVICPLFSCFNDWVEKNCKPNEEYIMINNINDVMGRSFDRIVKAKRWQAVSKEVVDTALSRVKTVESKEVE